MNEWRDLFTRSSFSLIHTRDISAKDELAILLFLRAKKKKSLLFAAKNFTLCVEWL